MGAVSVGAMTDEEIVDYLVGSITDENQEVASCPVFDDDENACFFAVGYDAEDNPGELVKLVVPLKK